MRNFVRTILASATVTAGILALSSPVSAAVTLCSDTDNKLPKCGATDVNVLVNQQTAPMVTASDNDSGTNVTYQFSSNGTEANLVQVASGQADVSSSDGVINEIVFSIIGGAANLITFNLLPLGPQSMGTDAMTVTVTSISAITGISTTDIVNLSPNGNNFYGIQAGTGDVLTQLTFKGFTSTTNGTNVGIQALQQIRLDLAGSVAAVPEPTTWMLMLLGMAGIGFSMRRKDKQTLRVRYA